MSNNFNFTPEERFQIERVVKGEIGPNNLTTNEAATMIQTMVNRRFHKDVNSSYNDPSAYHTLKYPNQNYQLNDFQQNTLNQAFELAKNQENKGYLGWDTSNTSIPSNRYYQWNPIEKQGQHYYYEANKN